MRKLSIIIPAYNEAETIEAVIASAKQLMPHEVIVVANGCTDQTAHIAKVHGCHTIITEQLGNDVGRMIGAQAATGDVLLFLDADFAIAPRELASFINPALHGQADVVLNNFDALFMKKQRPHSTTIWRQVTNELIGRSDLKSDSILSVPHVFTKEAIAAIGYEALQNPITAQVRIGMKGLRVNRHQAIEVIAPNKFRPEEHSAYGHHLARSEERIIGDHIEALGEWLQNKNKRGNYTDGGRVRDIQEHLPFHQGWGIRSQLYGGKQLSVIIPVQNEEDTIGAVIQEARKIEPFEIIVVVNGSSDRTATIAKQCGATVVDWPQALGNDTGRTVGARIATGDIMLFIDGDFAILARDLYPYAKAVADGVDVALNDLNHYLTLRFPLHLVTAMKYALNLACSRKDLGVGSLQAVPNAFSRRCVEGIGAEALTSPVLAQVKAIKEGYRVQCVHRVEVDKMNRIRPDQHFSPTGHAPAVVRIIGDHVEGISYLHDMYGIRGGFHDGGRRRQ
ncbi:glycosyltransferase [Ectobacillus sp. JY-23]|uniref:glycosyltransferase family 2 protein n=1 Tax=Ectobacillus sp. JY-23 TaxID=2933872 RepID=UPI001FF203F2|nr:glycosyltransferase [Ectobacillus sp. JY-23]UOY91802.1 glycosyltransferase [Ectobacillus sp. JY-23]